MFGYSKEAVRVKVKKCEGKLQPELRKFSVDPQITSLEVLQSILVKAFDIKSDFTLSYRSVDDYGQEIHLPLLSDWDLDAAFLKAHNIALSQKSEPCVQLKVDMKPFAEASEDWEPPNVTPAPVSENREQTVAPAPHQTEKQEAQTGFQGLFMNQVEKTFNMVSRALNLYEDPSTPPRAPLCDTEFRAFLDTVGMITDTARLREVIYCGGIEPSLRKVVWKHILNVYPEGMTGKERMDYIKRKANEYYALRARWKDCIQKGTVNPDLAYVTGMVRKDVLRTDRHHPFYAGSDDNQNIASLFNILTTYALNHPTVSYCQGMSDLASPLLVTMGDEAHAYICLCALMARLYPNFLLDGEAMTLKFTHLTESLQVYDPDFYNYLKSQQADDLLFCYRWLLLEMKREFAFEDALRMLEVLWASLPPRAPAPELALRERGLARAAPPAARPTETAYTKLCAIRRQSSGFSLHHPPPRPPNRSLDDTRTSRALQRSKATQSLDDAALQPDRDEAKEHVKSSARRSMRSVPEAGRSSAGDLHNGSAHGDGRDAPLGDRVRLLRDKISHHNDKYRSTPDSLADPAGGDAAEPRVKMVKNLNEFLNLAAASEADAVTRERLQRTRSAIERSSTRDRPRITLTTAAADDGRPAGARDERLAGRLARNVHADGNDGSSPDDSQEYYPMTTSMTRELRLELEHLDRQVFGPCARGLDSPPERTRREAPERARRSPPPDGGRPATRSAEDVYLWENPLHRPAPARAAASCPQTPDEQVDLDYDGEIFEEHSGKKSVTPIRLLRRNPPSEPREAAERAKESAQSSESDSSERETPGDAARGDDRQEGNASRSQKFFSSMSQELENAKRNCESLLTAKQPNLHSVASTINSFQKKYEVGAEGRGAGALPAPGALGGGNPFLVFLCLTVLLQHRDYIMRNRMDYNELAMHFDKMVRKHNVNRVLNQARQMYALYLKQQARKTGDVTT